MRTKRTRLVAAVAALVLVAAVGANAQFQSVGTAADDDMGSGSEEDGLSND